MSQRFTDAELAAEKWHKMYMWRVAEVTRSAFGSSELFEQREHEASTIIRFATLPHAHEPQTVTPVECLKCGWSTEANTLSEAIKELTSHRDIHPTIPTRKD